MKKEKEMAEYWKKARQFVRLNTIDPQEPAWFAFEWNDPERKLWQQYFARKYGYEPTGLKYLRQGVIDEFLVPARIPEEFDV
jgi:hypothetical protein